MEGRIRVIAAVVRRDGRYLICRRPAHKRHGGLWEFPGGKLERNETVLEAARRELAEELGVDVTSVGEVEFSFLDPGSDFVIEFHPVSIVGEPQCIEHSNMAWVEPEHLTEHELAPSDRAFAEFIRGGTGVP